MQSRHPAQCTRKANPCHGLCGFLADKSGLPVSLEEAMALWTLAAILSGTTIREKRIRVLLAPGFFSAAAATQGLEWQARLPGSFR